MKTKMEIYLYLLLVLSSNVLAVGGQQQKDMMCDEQEHRGVGRVYTFESSDAKVETSRGTMQVLPWSNRKLCITASHCVIPGYHTTGVMAGEISIWASRIFIHPDLDLAILELEESVPDLQEEDLPSLPPKRHKRRSSRRNSAEERRAQDIPSLFGAQIVGFGATSSDDMHPGLLTPNSRRSKNKGNVDVRRQGFEYVSEWKLIPDERQVYAAPGDSGGPLLLGKTLMGITTSHKECFSWILKDFCSLTKEQHTQLVKDNKKPFGKFDFDGDKVFIYDAEDDDNVKIYIEGSKYSHEDILTIIARESGLYKCSEILPFRSIVDRVLHLSRDETRIVHTSYFVDITQCMGWIEGIYTQCGLSIKSN